MDSSRHLDYTETVKYFHELANTRFKLLTIIPTISGVAISMLMNNVSDVEEVHLIISILGFLSVLGVMFYDQRNTEIYDKMQLRAKMLEAELGFIKFDDDKYYGGPFLDRPKRQRKFLGILRMWHDLGLTIIYSAALGAWVFLISQFSYAYYNIEQCYYEIFKVLPFFFAAITYSSLVSFDKPTDKSTAFENKNLKTQIYKNYNPSPASIIKARYSKQLNVNIPLVLAISVLSGSFLVAFFEISSQQRIIIVALAVGIYTTYSTIRLAIKIRKFKNHKNDKIL